LLKRIYGLKTDEEVMGEWRKLHNEELYSSPSMIGIIGSMRMRCAGYVARMGGEENTSTALHCTISLHTLQHITSDFQLYWSGISPWCL
jgi:hypothetical protein